MTSIHEWEKILDDLKSTLIRASAQRHLRQHTVAAPDGYQECEWVTFERQQMANAVNRLRAARGLPAVTLTAVIRVENMAVGHSDYVTQFAVGCAEIIVGRRDPDTGQYTP